MAKIVEFPRPAESKQEETSTPSTEFDRSEFKRLRTIFAALAPIGALASIYLNYMAFFNPEITRTGTSGSPWLAMCGAPVLIADVLGMVYFWKTGKKMRDLQKRR